MDINEWNDLTRKIVASAGDQSVLTGLLTQATDAFSEQLTTAEQKKAEAEKLQQDNEALRKANMDFFLRIGEQAKESHTKQDTKERPSDAEKITFADLFKEEK